MSLVGIVLMWIGLVLFFIGILGFLYCKEFGGKLLVTSVMDACGLLTFMTGAMFRFGFGINTFKIGLILVTVWIISPLSSHELTRLSKITEQEEKELT